MSLDDRPAAEWFIMTFSGNADSLAMHYGSPVYLVGSALVEPHPADFDIRIPLNQADVSRMFGEHNTYRTEPRRDFDVTPSRIWRWRREELKQSRRLSRRLRVFVDLQFQDAAGFYSWRNAGKPRLRLDSATGYFISAGDNEPT